MRANEVIKSVSYDQEEIINNILSLYNKNLPIEFDPCYNVGGFYRSGVVVDPEIKSDINPLLPGVEKMDVRFLPFESRFRCIIFDPPFVVTGGSSRMFQRYGSFENFDELRLFWNDSLSSLQRALKNRGILIVKCQDFVNGRQNHIFVNDIMSMARDKKFKIMDLFVLISKSRPLRMKKQQHARKYHCYFLVLKKNMDKNEHGRE